MAKRTKRVKVPTSRWWFAVIRDCPGYSTQPFVSFRATKHSTRDSCEKQCLYGPTVQFQPEPRLFEMREVDPTRVLPKRRKP